MMKIHCQTGLAGRVTAIANGLALAGEIDFHWRQNEACPFPHHYFFPNGISGVTFIDEADIVWMTRMNGKTCDHYQPHVPAPYARIMEAMTGEATHKPRIAVFGRFFRHPLASPIALAHGAAAHAEAIGADRVFLMADAHRATITKIIESAGIEVIQPKSAELRHDLDRSVMRDFIDDWKTLAAAEEIVTHQQPSGMLHPAMAAGVPIHRI